MSSAADFLGDELNKALDRIEVLKADLRKTRRTAWWCIYSIFFLLTLALFI